MPTLLTDPDALFEEIEAEFIADRAGAKDRLMHRYVGKAARFTLTVEEVRHDENGQPYLALVPGYEPNRLSRTAVLAHFPSSEKDAVRSFVPGNPCTVTGVVTRVVRGGVFLGDCSLVRSPGRPRGP